MKNLSGKRNLWEGIVFICLLRFRTEYWHSGDSSSHLCEKFFSVKVGETLLSHVGIHWWVTWTRWCFRNLQQTTIKVGSCSRYFTCFFSWSIPLLVVLGFISRTLCDNIMPATKTPKWPPGRWKDRFGKRKLLGRAIWCHRSNLRHIRVGGFLRLCKGRGLDFPWVFYVDLFVINYFFFRWSSSNILKKSCGI